MRDERSGEHLAPSAPVPPARKVNAGPLVALLAAALVGGGGTPKRPNPKWPGKPTPVVKRAPAVAAAKAQVEFRVGPFGAVWVDGTFLGDTPFSPANLSLGAHTVRVVNRDLGKEVTKSLEVKEGSNVFRHSFEE